MAGNVNDRFKQVATTSMLSSSSIQQNLTLIREKNLLVNEE